ncbi:protein of unknown function [Nitratireductor aquimarinus]
MHSGLRPATDLCSKARQIRGVARSVSLSGISILAGKFNRFLHGQKFQSFRQFGSYVNVKILPD